MRWLERYLISPFPRPPAATLLEVYLASFTVAGGGAVAAFGAVTRVPVFRPRVAQTVAVDVAEIPRLALEYGLVAPGAVVETGLNRGG